MLNLIYWNLIYLKVYCFAFVITMNKYSKNYLDKISSSKVYDVAIKSPITKAESVSSQFSNNIFLKRESSAYSLFQN